MAKSRSGRKSEVLAFLMIALVVKMIKPKIAKILRLKRSMFRVNILALRNARQPLNNLLHSTTLPVDAIN